MQTSYQCGISLLMSQKRTLG